MLLLTSKISKLRITMGDLRSLTVTHVVSVTMTHSARTRTRLRATAVCLSVRLSVCLSVCLLASPPSPA